MPIPKTRDVGKTIRFLKRDKPGMPAKQRLAIALNTSRRSGSSISDKARSIRKKGKNVFTEGGTAL